MLDATRVGISFFVKEKRLLGDNPTFIPIVFQNRLTLIFRRESYFCSLDCIVRTVDLIENTPVLSCNKK